MTAKKRQNSLLRFLLQFHQPLIYILLASAAIAGAMGEWVDALVIFSVALINAVVGYLQESKAEKSLEAQNPLPNIKDAVLSTPLATR